MFEYDRQGDSYEYLVLKLTKKVDLMTLINELLAIDKDTEHQWYDLAEILLKADGSWDKEPRLYNKYKVIKND